MEIDVPIIKLFIVNGNFYVYDTYCNNILRLSKEQYLEVELLCRLGICKYRKLNKNIEEYNDIIQLINKGYFKDNNVKKILNSKMSFIKSMTDRYLSELVLQVTQNCNLNCRYCLYAQNNKIDRSHQFYDMEWEIAKKSIDYLFSHAQDANTIKISFYGGEPLLNYELIKKAVEYSKALFKYKAIEYTLTTNGSIMNDDIAEFLITNSITVYFSMDGPSHFQNKHRVFASNGEGTFNLVYRNIKLLKRKSGDYFNKKVGFIAVLFEDEEKREVLNFFHKFMHNEERLKIVPADTKGVDYIKCAYTKSSERLSIYNIENHKELYDEYNAIYDDKSSIPNTWHHNGPCIPASRKLFVSCSGDFYPCEKVCEIDSCQIGNLNQGLHLNKIYELVNIGDVSSTECKNCWAKRFCSICVADCFNLEGLGISKSRKLDMCNLQKHSIMQYLKSKVITFDKQIMEQGII